MMALPLKNGLIDWPEWHRQIVRDNLELALGARENAKLSARDKYLNAAGYPKSYRRKALIYIKVANRHYKAAKEYANV